MRGLKRDGEKCLTTTIMVGAHSKRRRQEAPQVGQEAEREISQGTARK